MTAARPSGRVLAPERMDHEAVAPEDLARALRDLERLAAWGRAHRPTLDWIARIAKGRRTLRVLDVGAGGGEALRRIARWAAGAGIAAELEGLDLNPGARVAAEAATDPALPIRFRTGDVFGLDPGERWDVVVSAHFAHHLTDAELARFLRWSEGAARLGWFVNDLRRHRLPRAALRAAGAVLPLHRFVAHDGPVSVGRAFVREDWERALDAAGIDPGRVEIRRWFPFRWGVGTRPEA